jgi:hypothetical protein
MRKMLFGKPVYKYEHISVPFVIRSMTASLALALALRAVQILLLIWARYPAIVFHLDVYPGSVSAC